MTRTHLLAPVETALDAFAQGALAASALSDTARAQTELLAALPPRYTEVLHGLLDRLESSALFSVESCSFSHQGLLDSLQQWLDKARATLAGKTA